MSLQIHVADGVRIPKWQLAQFAQLQGQIACCPGMDWPLSNSWLCPTCLSIKQIDQWKPAHYFPAVTQPIGSFQQIESGKASSEHQCGGCFIKPARKQINHCEVVIRGCLHCDYGLIHWISLSGFLLSFTCTLPFPAFNLRIKLFYSKYKN